MKRLMIAFLLLMATGVWADDLRPASVLFDDYFNNNFKVGGLSLPANMKMSHSMSFSAAGSNTGNGWYGSSYTNTINYAISPKLNLRMDLSLVNQGTATFDNSFNVRSDNNNNTHVLPSFDLTWKPNDTTTVKFIMQSGTAYWPYYRTFEPHD